METSPVDWVSIILQVGLPSLALIAIGRFFANRIWPAAVKAWETQQSERREERQEFLKALSEEREAFNSVLAVERRLRTDERNMFLQALDGYRKQLETIAEILEESNGHSKKDK